MSGFNSVRPAVEIYSALNWSVIPVDRNTKKPLIHWKTYQQRLPNQFDFNEWGHKFKHSGIAVITGPVSGLVVLDADGAEGVAEVKSHGLVKTPMAITPRGGMHFYYKWPSDIPMFLNSVKLGESKRLDIRGDAAYVVAPYTRRDDGKRYEWIERPDKVEPAAPPGWFVKILKRAIKTDSRGNRETASNACGNREAASTLVVDREVGTSLVSGPSRASLVVCEGLISSLPSEIQRFILEGHDLSIFPSRSECDMAVVVSLLIHGAPESSIKEIFAHYPIGDKYRERDEGSHYLERTLVYALSRVKTVKIKYADPVKYEQSSDDGPPGVRLQLYLSIVGEDGSIRSGLTMPDDYRSSGQFKNCPLRWKNFFSAVGIERGPDTYERLQIVANRLIGKKLTIEVDHKEDRTNPVRGFYKYVRTA